MTVLDVLLEGFDEARHPRDFRGRFKAGDHVTLTHGMFGRVPARVTKVTASRVFVTSSDSRVSDTSMTHNQAAVKLEHMIGPHAVRPRLAKGQTANELRGGVPRMSVVDARRERELRGGASYRAGDKVHVVNPQGKPSNGVVEKGPETYSAITSRGARRQTTVQVRWDDGDVTHERPQDVRPGHHSSAANAARAATARAGQGAGTPVFSSGRLITAPQRKRLASVIADIHANAWQDRSYMNSLISGALRDSGHVMGMSPGWMDRLHTNHASQLIKDLERLAKHGPGEMAREAAVLGVLLEGH